MPKAPKWLNDTLEGLMASKMPVIRVTETSFLNPFLKKVCFEGDLSGQNFELGYAISIRVSDTEYRNYTASFSDTQRGIMEIIVHLHGNAPGSGYIDNLKVGDELRIVFPRGHKMYNDAVKRQVFFGDETSLAFAFAIHPFLKQNHHEYHFYLELDAVNAGIPDLLGLDNCTVLTKRETFISEQLLAMLPVFSEQVWKDANFLLTGNAKSVQTIRKAIKRIDITGRIFAKAYWAEGRAGL